MNPDQFCFSFKPRIADIDANFHFHHTAYLDWATHARMEWLEEKGFTLQKLLELRIASILTEENIKFFKEIKLGQNITVDITCVGLSSDASRWHLRQEFRRGDTVCALYEVKGAWMDLTTRRLAPPPPGLLEATKSLVRAQDYADIQSN